MLALEVEQLAEKWPLIAGGGSSDRSDRLWLRAWPTTPFCSRAVTISSHTSDKYNQTGRQTDSDRSGCESGWTGKTETYHKIYLMLAISQLFYTRFDRVATSPTKFPCNLTMSRYRLSKCIPQTPTFNNYEVFLLHFLCPLPIHSFPLPIPSPLPFRSLPSLQTLPFPTPFSKNPQTVI